MESSRKNSCSVIQYYKGTETDKNNAQVKTLNSLESQNSVDDNLKEILSKSSKSAFIKSDPDSTVNRLDNKGEFSVEYDINHMRKNDKWNCILNSPNNPNELEESFKLKEFNCNEGKSELREMGEDVKFDLNPSGTLKESEKNLGNFVFDGKKTARKSNTVSVNLEIENSEIQHVTRGRKRKLSMSVGNESTGSATNLEDADGNEESLDSDMHCNEDADKPRRRGRRKGKKNAEAIPPHLSSDMVLGYKMLVRFLETPQFFGFHKPFKRSNGGPEDSKITCLNQIKKKFEENSYKMVCEFVNDVREMLMNIYESRNPVAIKRALRLEQVLEQRIAQLPNYLRPQCALVLPPDEINNSHNKIRISKGGGFVSLLLEKTEKQRYEKNKEKRKLMAEERKQLKEEQNKDVQEWEKNVLLKDFEEEIKSMWELPAIGHFIHLCADILNIGEVAQFEIERMLLMPQCSDTLDLIMTALLTNSLMRAKLDRIPSMPYTIWGPLVRTRVVSWYRIWHKEGRNEQKLFEEIGIEPEFWQILGPDVNLLDYYYFHEISLLQRVWILKTLCDVDFVRKRTVHDNIRAQTLDELNPVYLGIDRHGNRYIQLKQFCSADVRIYRQSSKLEGDITVSEFVENFEGFEHREGPITVDKVFRDIWELADKPTVKVRKKKSPKAKKKRNWNSVVSNSLEEKNLRRSARAKKKTYVDWSDSDQSDTDLITLKKKLSRSDAESLYRPFSEKEFISLSVFRLPRDKVAKPSFKRSSYVKKTEESSKTDRVSGDKSIKMESEDGVKEEINASVSGFGEDEQSDSLDAKQMREIQSDFERTFHGDDMNGDEFDLEEKLKRNFDSVDKVKEEGDGDEGKFSVKNLEDLKVVFKKGSNSDGTDEKIVKSEDGVSGKEIKVEESPNSMKKEYDSLYRYEAPDHLKPDSSKFYLVVDSVEGLRQLISKFGSHENDLEIITRSTKSKKKTSQSNTSCEVELIERLQNLLVELEPWEIDFMKSHRANKEKMYKEYMSFINRPPDYVRPNESYWMKTYEEPVGAGSGPSTSATAATGTTGAAIPDGSSANGEKGSGRETAGNSNESKDGGQSDGSLDTLVPRRRTRVTRMQIQPEENEMEDDSDGGDDYESNESDDNWVMPTSKKKSKKETPAKSPKFPKRSSGRKMKPSPHEKTESSTGEKSHSLSPEKTKKALFWGPRSSDPSEDLNWEKNRQKILEKHNSPVKKAIFKSEDIASEIPETQKSFEKPENPTASVIAESPKRLTTLIPGNKKPYFSSAQLKAMENQAKQGKLEESKKVSAPAINAQQTDSKSNAMTPEYLVFDSGNKAPVKLQTYSRYNNNPLKQLRNPQVANRPRQPSPKQLTTVPVVGRMEATNSNFQQPVKFATQVRETIQQNPANNQKVTSVGVIQQKGMTPVQIQIQQPCGQSTQNRGIVTSLANVSIQQPIQWQPKVITVQSVNQQGKVVQQQLQTQSTQVPIQGQSQVQLQSQPQVQGGQVQQVIQVDHHTWSALQQPIQAVQSEKLGNVQQVVISQGQTQSSGTPNSDNDLYVTDGKILMKFDNFVQQCLTKEKVVALNVNEKLDVKKPLLIVKPSKTDSSAGTGQAQGETPPSTSQQNVLVINKSGSVQPETVAPSSVQNYVIPGNYIVKEENSSQSGQQTVKIVQQPQTYIIQQQKPVAGKSPQTQIIKIITSQPVGSNQNLILSPTTLSGGSQVIRSVTQTVVASDQQSKGATTLRFLRPHIATSNPAAQGKTTTVQNPIQRVSSIIQIQSSEMETSKSQVIAGKIASTGVPTVRMTTPVQTQFLSSGNSGTQSVKLSGQPLKVTATCSQSQALQTSTLIPTSVTLNPQAVRLTTVNAVRLATTIGQHQGVVVAAPNQNLQSIASTTGLNALPLRVVAGVQPSQTQTVVANPNLQAVLATSVVETQATGGQPLQVQSQTAGVSSNLTLCNQPVRLVSAVGQSQPSGKPIANNNAGPRLVKNGPPGTVMVITSAAQSAGGGTIGSAGIGGQPARVQSVLQSSGVSGESGLHPR